MRHPDASVRDPNSFVSSSGDLFHVRLAPRVLEDGTLKLVESGKDDIKSMINSFRDSTDMSFILNRLAVGDTSVLDQRPALFGDFTQMPTTYAEALQLVIDGRRQFDALPLDVKNSFNNDYRQFLATAGTDEWSQKLSSLRTDEHSEPGVIVDQPSVAPSVNIDRKE